ncbi:hypothetical protein AAEU33_10785 [Chryseobacterium sp. Chry.R1]|uniref:hypothetical protein n=1 Tax=Chryseobacterium sp. Chry.R1 TaxID=3139392 RepID=UPI0031F9043B
MMSSFIYANTGYGKNKIENSGKKEIKKEPRVDSFKIVGENFDDVNKECSITVNYYSLGQYVGQQTYSGNTAALCGVKTCGQWRDTMISAINSWVNTNEAMYPSCNDCAC